MGRFRVGDPGLESTDDSGGGEKGGVVANKGRIVGRDLRLEGATGGDIGSDLSLEIRKRGCLLLGGQGGVGRGGARVNVQCPARIFRVHESLRLCQSEDGEEEIQQEG